MSQKTEVIERLFERRWDTTTDTLRNPVVSLTDVQEAIRERNAAHPEDRRPLSDRNPANFFKDFIRNKRSANQNWPSSVMERGYTGRQLTGGDACFEFIPLAADQAIPFPMDRIPAPTEHTSIHHIESASLPLASRRLGRSDEAWLVQVLVRLRVIETHLAVYSQRQVVQVDHLQMNVKHHEAEIDALFLAIEEREGGQTSEVIICCEAKGLRDDILESQVLSQVRTVFRMPGVEQNTVLPLAVKVLGPSLVHVVEFEVVARSKADTTETLSVASEAIYEFHPPVPGIGTSRRASRRRRAEEHA